MASIFYPHETTILYRNVTSSSFDQINIGCQPDSVFVFLPSSDLPVTTSYISVTSSWSVSSSWSPAGGGVTPGGSYDISASWASSSISASYAPGSNGTTLSTGSTYPITASWSISASWSPAGGGVTPGGSYNISSSWASSSISASYTNTASWAINTVNGGGVTPGGSYNISSSWASSSLSASYIFNDNRLMTVLNYGLVNNGVYDCTTPLQNLINALPSGVNNSIYFPAGTYIISDTVTINKDNIKIWGDNATLKMSPSSVASSKLFIISGSNIEISNLNLDGNQWGMMSIMNNYGLYFQYCNGIRINNIICNNFSLRGMELAYCQNVIVDNSIFNKNGGEGMETIAISNCQFNNCQFSENGYYGARYEDFGHGFVPIDHRVAFGVAIRFISNDIQFYNCISSNNGRDGLDVNQGSHDIDFFNCICNGNNDGGFTIAADNTNGSIPGNSTSPYNLKYYNCIAENNTGAGLVAYCPIDNISVIGGEYYNNRRAPGWAAGEEATSLQPNIYLAAGSTNVNIESLKCYDNRQIFNISSFNTSSTLLMITASGTWNGQYNSYYPGVTLLTSASKFVAYGEIVTSSLNYITIKPTSYNTFDPATVSSSIVRGYVTQKKVSTGILFDHACQATVNVTNFGNGFVPSATWDMTSRNVWASYLNNLVGSTDVKIASGLLSSPDILLNGNFSSSFDNWTYAVEQGDTPSFNITAAVDSPEPSSCDFRVTDGSIVELYPDINLSLGIKNKYITFGGWVKSNSKSVCLQTQWYSVLGDIGQSRVSSSGDSQWQWLELSGLNSNSPGTIGLRFVGECSASLAGFICTTKKL